MTDWQPIETAPKDGTPILAYCQFTEDSCDIDNYWISEWDDYHGVFTPYSGATHWQPLPDPPVIK